MDSSFVSIAFLVILFGMMYFTMVRPQQKKEKETKKMLSNLKPGDDIVTIGGIYGKVARIKEDSDRVVILVGSERTKLEIARAAISGLDIPAGKKKKEEDKATEEVAEKPNKKNIKKLGAKEEVPAVAEAPAAPAETPAENKAE